MVVIYWNPTCFWPSRVMASKKPRSLTHIKFSYFSIALLQIYKIVSCYFFLTSKNIYQFSQDPTSSTALSWPLWAIWITFSILTCLSHYWLEQLGWLLKSGQPWRPWTLRVSGICCKFPVTSLGLSLFTSITWLVKTRERIMRSSAFIAWTTKWLSLEIYKLQKSV